MLTLTRDDDSRSDVWSVEVLPSDSEPPDIRSEDRLKELESESGNAVSKHNVTYSLSVLNNSRPANACL